MNNQGVLAVNQTNFYYDKKNFNRLGSVLIFDSIYPPRQRMILMILLTYCFNNNEVSEMWVLLGCLPCMDCHSIKPEFPLVLQCTACAWFLNDHVVDGKKNHLNFFKTSTKLPFGLISYHKFRGDCWNGGEKKCNTLIYTYLDSSRANLTQVQQDKNYGIGLSKAQMDI